jgi:hypothetical protein
MLSPEHESKVLAVVFTAAMLVLVLDLFFWRP